MEKNTNITPIREMNSVSFFDITIFLKNPVGIKDIYDNWSVTKNSPYYPFQKTQMNASANSFALILPKDDDEPNVDVNWAVMLANKFITSRHFQFRIWEQSLSQALSFFHASPEQYKDNIVSSISIEYNNRFNFKIPCNPSELFTANEFIPNRFLSNMTPLNYRFDYTEQSRECQNSLYFMYLSIHPTDGHKAIDVNTRAHISLEEDISMSNEIKSDAFLCMANEMNFLIKELFLNLLSTNARAMISMFD